MNLKHKSYYYNKNLHRLHPPKWRDYQISVKDASVPVTQKERQQHRFETGVKMQKFKPLALKKTVWGDIKKRLTRKWQNCRRDVPKVEFRKSTEPPAHILPPLHDEISGLKGGLTLKLFNNQQDLLSAPTFKILAPSANCIHSLSTKPYKTRLRTKLTHKLQNTVLLVASKIWRQNTSGNNEAGGQIVAAKFYDSGQQLGYIAEVDFNEPATHNLGLTDPDYMSPLGSIRATYLRCMPYPCMQRWSVQKSIPIKGINTSELNITEYVETGPMKAEFSLGNFEGLESIHFPDEQTFFITNTSKTEVKSENAVGGLVNVGTIFPRDFLTLTADEGTESSETLDYQVKDCHIENSPNSTVPKSAEICPIVCNQSCEPRRPGSSLRDPRILNITSEMRPKEPHLKSLRLVKSSVTSSDTEGSNASNGAHAYKQNSQTNIRSNHISSPIVSTDHTGMKEIKLVRRLGDYYSVPLLPNLISEKGVHPDTIPRGIKSCKRVSGILVPALQLSLVRTQNRRP